MVESVLRWLSYLLDSRLKKSTDKQPFEIILVADGHMVRQLAGAGQYCTWV
jgi:hypothetical protein